MSPFDRTSRANDSNHKPLSKRLRRRKAAAKARANLLHERLEGRAMMAIFAVPQNTGGGTVIAIDGNAGLTDLYLRGTLGGGVEVATNSSFNPVPTADPLDWFYSGFGTNGLFNDNLHTVSGAGPLYITSATPNIAPFAAEANGFTNGSTSRTTDFVLSNGNINSDIANAVIGELRLGGRAWTFTNDGNGRLSFTQTAGAPGGPQPRDGLSTVSPGVTNPGLRGGGVRGSITISWDAPVSTFEADCPRMDVSYTYRNFIGLLPPAVPRPPDSSGSDFDIGVSAGSIVSFSIPSIPPKNAFGGTSLGPVPGTEVTSGTITVHDVLVSGTTGSRRVDLNFGFTNASGTLVFTPEQNDWLQIDPDSTLQNLRFVNRFGVAPQNGSVEILPGESDVTPGRVTISGTQRHLEYTIEQRPNQVTVWPGFDVRNAITVELTQSGGSFNVLSPIVNAASLAALGTTNVYFEAPTSVTGGITLAQSNVPFSLRPDVQTAVVEAPNAARSYSFNIVGGSLTVSPSGSLSGALPSPSGELTTPSASVNALMQDSDLLTLGTIYASTQFYDLKSPTLQYIRNTRFSTQIDDGGPDIGLVRGTTVVVAMANPGATDVPPTAFTPDISVHTVSLKTQVETFRTRAAGRGPDFPAQSNFPYVLAIREQDDITIDAVAGSNMPISFEAGGSIRFASALVTASDISIKAAATGGDAARLTISAPVSTTKGQIRLIGDSVAINDAVLVTAAAIDSDRNDIYVTANSGDISLAGLVSARNRVKLEQRSPLTGVVSETSYQSRGAVPISDNGIAVASIVVPDDFVFDDIDVEVDITHPFVGDLTGTLIAPDGRRIRLFSRNGGSGDNFTDTIFDSEAVDANGLPRPISAGAAPFTGRFRPLDSLTAVYGTSALGTWQLEVRDEASGDTGTLDNFTLRFGTRSFVPADRRIFGAGRVVADRLDIDAQGAVGNPSLLPTDTNFFLRTDVNTLAGRTGASMSIDERNDINVVDLRAPGFVSLRANGPDPASGQNAGNAALKATLIDITGLDVASPNGSVDVLFDTAKTIELGNAKGLQLGRFLNSTAAGDVSVRSTAGSIVVLDGPVAAGNARRVRAGTQAELAGVTYSPGNPGISASTLSGAGNLSSQFTGIGATLPLRVGERVLVKNQSDARQNGVYQLTAMSTPTWSSATSWTLTRAGNSDTADELPNNTFVRVGEGDAAGVWQINVNYTSSSLGNAPITVIQRTVTTDIGSDDPNDLVTFVVTTTGSTNSAAGSLGKMISLRQENVAPLGGDPGVTKTGTNYVANSNEVEVPDADRLIPGMLVSGPGIAIGTRLVSIVNGTKIALSRPTTAASEPGNSTLVFAEPQKMAFRFSNAIATTLTPIQLTQELPEILSAFTINGAARYSSPLPVAGQPSQPIIDGSRITHTRTGRSVVAGDVVSGLVVSGAAASGTTIRTLNVSGFGRAAAPQMLSGRLTIGAVRVSNLSSTQALKVGMSVAGRGVPPGATIRTIIDATNIELSVPAIETIPSAALTFTMQSAAIDVRDAAGVLISNVTLGVSELGFRLANGVGARFSGPGVTSGTLLNSSIFGSNDSGLVVENGASGVSVVGSTFGRSDNFNGVGATLSSGVNQFGVDPSTPVRPIPQVQATRVAANRLQFALPTDWSPWRLVSGLQILSPGVTPTSGNSRATISAVTITATTVTVTVTGGAVVGVAGSSTSPFPVTFVANDPAAIPDSPATRVENRFTLTNATGITAGMQVSGPNIRLAAGSRAATVRQVGPSNGVTTFEISGGTIVGDGEVTFGNAAATRFSRMATKVVNAFALSAAARSVSALLYPGLALTGPTIQVTPSGNPDVPNRTPASISAIERNLVTGVTTVTIAGGTLTGNGSVSFGHVVYTELNARTITLPESVVFDNLYLGQTVRGTGIAGNTVITEINSTNRTVKFAEERKMTRTGFSVITFDVGDRNRVTQNRTGLILAGGATTVTNTTISANAFNGVEIWGSGQVVDSLTRHHRIGTSIAPAAGSNNIDSNGGWGVLFAPSMNDTGANADARKNLVRVRGNFLGTTSLAVVTSSFANRRRNDGSVGNIGHVSSGVEAKFAGLSNQFVPRSIDELDASNNQHGRYQVSGGAGGGGGVVPNTPTTRRR